MDSRPILRIYRKFDGGIRLRRGPEGGTTPGPLSDAKAEARQGKDHPVASPPSVPWNRQDFAGIDTPAGQRLKKWLNGAESKPGALRKARGGPQDG